MLDLVYYCIFYLSPVLIFFIVLPVLIVAQQRERFIIVVNVRESTSTNTAFSPTSSSIPTDSKTLSSSGSIITTVNSVAPSLAGFTTSPDDGLAISPTLKAGPVNATTLDYSNETLIYIPTPPTPATTTTRWILPNLNPNDYYIESVIDVVQHLNISTKEFKSKLESGLAEALSIGFQRRQAKRYGGKLDGIPARVKIVSIKQTSHGNRQTSHGKRLVVTYVVEHQGKYVISDTVVEDLDLLGKEEISEILNRHRSFRVYQVVETRAYGRIAKAESGNLWIIGLVIGVVIVLLILCWFCMFIYFNTCGRTYDESSEDLEQATVKQRTRLKEIESLSGSVTGLQAATNITSSDLAKYAMVPMTQKIILREHESQTDLSVILDGQDSLALVSRADVRLQQSRLEEQQSMDQANMDKSIKFSTRKDSASRFDSESISSVVTKRQINLVTISEADEEIHRTSEVRQRVKTSAENKHSEETHENDVTSTLRYLQGHTNYGYRGSPYEVSEQVHQMYPDIATFETTGTEHPRPRPSDPNQQVLLVNSKDYFGTTHAQWNRLKDIKIRRFMQESWQQSVVMERK